MEVRYVIRKYNFKSKKWVDIVSYADLELAKERYDSLTKNGDNSYAIQIAFKI